jgi:hypothetical protein
MLQITIHAAERASLPDGRVFTGPQAVGNAARALIADGADPTAPLVTRWADGRASMRGSVAAFARWRYSDDGRSRWAPHPKAVVPPRLAAWLAVEDATAKVRREGRRLRDDLS